MSNHGPKGGRFFGFSPKTTNLLKILILLALVTTAGGCAAASVANMIDGGPRENVTGWDAKLRTALASHQHDRALKLVQPLKAEAGDSLLQLQHRGLAAHYAGRWHESSDALEQAFRMAEDRYTESVSQALLSVIAHDAVIDYEPPHTERLMMHYYGALNYLRDGEPDEAAVEARRLSDRLRRSLDGDVDETPRELGHCLSRFAGAIFEAAGQAQNAAVAYRQGQAFAEDNRQQEDIPEALDPSKSSADSGKVLLVVERGFVAHRAEKSLTLLLFPDEIARVQRAAARLEAQNDTTEIEPVMEVAHQVERRQFHSGASISGDPVPVRIAWPVYRESTHPRGTADVRIEKKTVAAQPDAKVDLSQAAKETYKDRRALDIAKALLRAAVREGLAQALEGAASEADEGVGEIVGFASRVAGALVEKADTRSWHSLPGRLELYRFQLPPGTHQLSVKMPGGHTLKADTVTLEAGEMEVVSAREWR